MKNMLKQFIGSALLLSTTFCPAMAANPQPIDWKEKAFEIAVTNPAQFDKIIARAKQRTAEVRMELAAMTPDDPEYQTTKTILENQEKAYQEYLEMKSKASVKHSNV